MWIKIAIWILHRKVNQNRKGKGNRLENRMIKGMWLGKKIRYRNNRMNNKQKWNQKDEEELKVVTKCNRMG